MPADVQPSWILLEDLGAVDPDFGVTKTYDVGPLRARVHRGLRRDRGR